MGRDSLIPWTDHSQNFWQGCHKISAGCANCYMHRDKKRYGQDPTTVVRSSDATFYAPLKWKEPAKVFTCSWSDFFIEEADAWRDDAWDVIRRTPHLTWQILTKRPENILTRLPSDWGLGWPNVWLMVTVEDSKALRRLDVLSRVPAQVYGVSVEPMLEPLALWRGYRLTDDDDVWDEIAAHEDADGNCEPEEFIEECEAECDWVNFGNELVYNPEHREWQQARYERAQWLTLKRSVDWVVIGNESGPNARECKPEWAEWLIRDCRDAGIPVFVKGKLAEQFPVFELPTCRGAATNGVD